MIRLHCFDFEDFRRLHVKAFASRFFTQSLFTCQTVRLATERRGEILNPAKMNKDLDAIVQDSDVASEVTLDSSSSDFARSHIFFKVFYDKCSFEVY